VDFRDGMGASTAMSTPTQIAQLQQETRVPGWSFATRISFRFCFVYFGLYCLTTQILSNLIPIPKVDVPDSATLWPLRPIILWAAAHILRVTRPVVYADTGSGDKTFDWVLVFCLLVSAIVATGIWSVLDRKRENYEPLHKWLRLFIRIGLASEMILYGMSKLIPVQMPFPGLTTLIQPFGKFFPMGVLWSFIGASPAYEIFAGAAEMLGGLLLIVPRTTTLGALICLADITQVFMLNMTYDVPVKLFSFHLLLLALFLAAPELSRMADFFIRNRTVGTSRLSPLFDTRRGNRLALAVQIVLGIWMVGGNAYNSWHAWHLYGGGQPQSPLYGIWNVDQLSIDGQIRSPLLNDYDRWRRAIFDSPAWMSFQRMDDSFANHNTVIDVKGNHLLLTKDGDKNWKANFDFQRVAPDQLILNGNMDGHTIHMQLQLFNHKTYLVVTHRFHWVQEHPYTR
jgi:uncharacterized membrane protein YphA (DoxX/SURF4 family)